jgi:hypothetical protein
MHRIGIFIAVVLISTGRTAIAGPSEPRQRPAADTPSPAQPPNSAIRIALSQDGFSFAETDLILVKQADSPDIVRLPNDRLLAVFRHQPQPGAPPVLAAVQSSDDGRSWSAPRPLTFKGGTAESATISDPCLAVMPNGLLRLYFGLPAAKDGAARLGSAVTRDGVTYQADPETRVRCERTFAIDPVAFWAGPELRLLAVSVDAAPRRAFQRPPAVRVFTSTDGRHLKSAGFMREALTPSDVIGERNGYRMYVSDAGGIRCMVSGDGARWRLHPAKCLRGGSDPAVVQLKNGSFLMLYCTPLDDRPGRPAEKVLASVASPTADKGGPADQPTGTGQSPGAAQASGRDESPGTNQQSPSNGPAWEPFTDADTAGETAADNQAAPASPEVSDDARSQEFPPLPDFQNPVNYLSWYNDNSVPAAGENAWESYAGILLGDREGPEWKVIDVLDKGGWKTAEPWDPAAHPDWDTAFQSAQELLAKFREATEDPRSYAVPALFMTKDGKYVERPDGPGLLYEILLPHLAGSRYLAKTTLAGTWRMENGQIDPEKMKDAWTTVLGNAQHLEQGFSTIEKLVSVGERVLVEGHARSALERGVFQTADELEAALETLQMRDVPDPDPGSYARFECAANLDAIQYAFSPTGDGSAIVSNPEKAKRIANFFGKEQLSDEDLKQASAIDTKTVNEAVDLFNSHYREFGELMAKGYPALRDANFAKREEQRALSNPISKAIMPSLARARYLQTRAEASRRATQLSYSIELFRARNGRLPTSLDELPPEHRDAVRTDPFTDQDLRYRVNGRGFTIYTAGENGIDDGGIHSPSGDTTKDSNSDDYVFWPPQKN